MGGGIRIRYDAGDPNRVIPDSFWANWTYPLLLMVFAIVVFGFGVLWLGVFLLTVLVPSTPPSPTPS